MAPVIGLPDEQAVRWFLEKTRISVIFSSSAVTATIFPRHLRGVIAEHAPASDLGVAPPEALGAVCRQALEHGDCVIFARDKLVRRVKAGEQPRKRPPLLKAWAGAPGVAEGATSGEALVEGLKTAALLYDPKPPPVSEPPTPYQVLGLQPGASLMEVRRARRSRMVEYHPDKVAALGPKIRELAEVESRRINWAGAMLEKGHVK